MFQYLLTFARIACWSRCKGNVLYAFDIGLTRNVFGVYPKGTLLKLRSEQWRIWRSFFVIFLSSLEQASVCFEQTTQRLSTSLFINSFWTQLSVSIFCSWRQRLVTYPTEQPTLQAAAKCWMHSWKFAAVVMMWLRRYGTWNWVTSWNITRIKDYQNRKQSLMCVDRLCGLVVRVPGYRSWGPGWIPGASRFSEKHWVWNGVHSASWVQLKSYLEEKLLLGARKPIIRP
jgi:hypothetical protein